MKKLPKGFTLIELLVVISIIGLLSALLMANYNAVRQRARDAQRKSDIRNIQTALRIYYNDFSGYPTSNASGNILGNDSGAVTNWGATWTKSNHTYMNKLPIDPQTGTRDYFYTYVDADNYTLGTCLESSSGNACASPRPSWCISGGCAYVVAP